MPKFKKLSEYKQDVAEVPEQAPAPRPVAKSATRQKLRVKARTQVRRSDKPKSNRPETDLRQYARNLHKRMVG